MLRLQRGCHELTCPGTRASTAGMSEAIAYAQRDGIAEIVLDDGKVNAMSPAFFDGLNAALDRAESDDSAALLVVAGARAICSAG